MWTETLRQAFGLIGSHPSQCAYVLLGIVSVLSVIVWRQCRTVLCLRTGLERAHMRSFERERWWQSESLRRQNETVGRLLRAFSRAPTPSLRDLVADTEREWSLMHSDTDEGE